MKYIKVKWKHRLNEYTEPVWMYSELDKESHELRKVEVFADGHYQFAGPLASVGDTRLGLEPIPPLDEINKHEMFLGTEISQEEFEQVWISAQNAKS